MLVVKGSNFVHDEEFSPVFEILNFWLYVPINDQLRGPTGNVFNSFGLTDFVLLFFLCVYFGHIFFWY